MSKISKEKWIKDAKEFITLYKEKSHDIPNYQIQSEENLQYYSQYKSLNKIFDDLSTHQTSSKNSETLKLASRCAVQVFNLRRNFCREIGEKNWNNCHLPIMTDLLNYIQKNPTFFEKETIKKSKKKINKKAKTSLALNLLPNEEEFQKIEEIYFEVVTKQDKPKDNDIKFNDDKEKVKVLIILNLLDYIANQEVEKKQFTIDFPSIVKEIIPIIAITHNILVNVSNEYILEDNEYLKQIKHSYLEWVKERSIKPESNKKRKNIIDKTTESKKTMENNKKNENKWIPNFQQIANSLTSISLNDVEKVVPERWKSHAKLSYENSSWFNWTFSSFLTMQCTKNLEKISWVYGKHFEWNQSDKAYVEEIFNSKSLPEIWRMIYSQNESLMEKNYPKFEWINDLKKLFLLASKNQLDLNTEEALFINKTFAERDNALNLSKMKLLSLVLCFHTLHTFHKNETIDYNTCSQKVSEILKDVLLTKNDLTFRNVLQCIIDYFKKPEYQKSEKFEQVISLVNLLSDMATSEHAQDKFIPSFFHSNFLIFYYQNFIEKTKSDITLTKEECKKFRDTLVLLTEHEKAPLFFKFWSTITFSSKDMEVLTRITFDFVRISKSELYSGSIEEIKIRCKNLNYFFIY